jgi:RNA polymerase sigma factor (sigma-70 family)
MPTTPDVTTQPGQDFRTLLQRVREGSEDAAWELIGVYGPHIFRAVRRKLNSRMRPKFDSADFVQAVWASFFTSRSQIVCFNQPEELIAFLSTMAHNKVISELRRRMVYQNHNITREEPLHDSALPAPQFPVGHQPTPSQVAVARERWKKMVAGQPQHYREILSLRYMGETYEQIAEKVGLHERTVRKVVEQALGEQ